MVSFWPWKGDDNSAASFEKTLSALSTKITNANVKRDALKTRSRRFKALWTLYTSFAYILYTLILALVTGQGNWGPVEYAAVAGGPFVIYAVRYAISTVYEYRIRSSQAHIDSLNKQKDAAIEKFKEATKYNTTQKLLEKYDAAPKSQTPNKNTGEKRRGKGQADSQKGVQPARTNIPPPPTANIQRPAERSMPVTPDQQQQGPALGRIAQGTPLNSMEPRFTPSPVESGAEFAPNAFPASPQYSNPVSDSPKWYDRIMDVLLGEDETRPINRLALICQHCKLVNGQAPPGVKSLGDVGKWRCASCHGWNGEASEVENIIEDVAKDHAQVEPPSSTDGPILSEDEPVGDEAVIIKAESDGETSSDAPSRSTRSQTKVS